MTHRRGKKIAVGLLACLLSVFILLFAAILIVPRFIDRDIVKDKVRREVSQLVEGEFDFKRIDLSFFPMPHVLLADATLNLPQRLTASAQLIEVYLEILPLLTGKINLNNARIQQPDLKKWPKGGDYKKITELLATLPADTVRRCRLTTG